MTEQGTKKGKNRRRGRKSGEKSKVGDSVSDNLDDSISNYQAHKTPLIQLNEDAPTWYEYGKDFPGRNDNLGIVSYATSPCKLNSKIFHRFDCSIRRPIFIK